MSGPILDRQCACGEWFRGAATTTKCRDCRYATREHTCKQCGREFKGGPGAKFCRDCQLARHRACQNARAARVAAGGPSNLRKKVGRRTPEPLPVLARPASGAEMRGVTFASSPARRVEPDQHVADINAYYGTRYATIADYLADLPRRVRQPVSSDHLASATRTAAESRRGVVGVR
jgi:hypothetical protein